MFRNRDDELIDWMGRRLAPDSSDDAAWVEQALAVASVTPLTEAELDRILRKSRGELPFRHEEQDQPARLEPETVPFRRSIQRVRRIPRPVMWAAAACVLIAAGWLLWNSFAKVEPDSVTNRPLARLPIEIGQGQARLHLSSPSTRLTVVNAEKAQVKLHEGGVYLHTTPVGGAETETGVEVTTPVAKVATADARCHVHLLAGAAQGGNDLLAVLVLNGQVHVHNREGYEMAEAGELVFVESGAAPTRVSPSAFSTDLDSWSLAQEVLALLHHPEIQEELQLNVAQRDKLQRTALESIHSAGQLVDGFADLDLPHRKQRTSEFFAHQANELLEILDESQRQQFGQIRLQQVGVAALLRPEISNQLKLSPKQRENIQGNLAKDNLEQRRLFVQAAGTSVEVSGRLAKLRAEQVEAILAKLEPDQRALWNKLVGQPEFAYSPGIFDIDEKGYSFRLLTLQPRNEEQLWETWLFQADAFLYDKGPGFKMTFDQITTYREWLTSVKREAGAYRLAKHKEFKQLATKAAALRKQHAGEAARQALELEAETLHQPLAQIGDNWKRKIVTGKLLSDMQRQFLQEANPKKAAGLLFPDLPGLERWAVVSRCRVNGLYPSVDPIGRPF
jgi:hypothetical protein